MCAASTFGVSARDKDLDAAIAGGVIGLAVGAALSKHHNHHKDIYYQGYSPSYGDGGYDDYYRQSFSPDPKTVCYPAQRACYHLNGDYAGRWSQRLYGY